MGVYDTPAPADAAPVVTSVEIPDELGPLRLTEYGKGLRALTQARDWFQSLY